MSAPRVVLLSILLSAACGVALAQNGTPARGGSPADHGRWDPAEMRAHMEAHHAERIKALHDVLGIQPAQEAAFAAFTSSMRPPERDHDGDDGPGPHDAGARMSMTTPQRLDRMKVEMDRRFAAMREAFDRRAEATRALYAVLDPRQRTVMDALPELRGRHGGGDDGDRMGRRGPMEPGM